MSSEIERKFLLKRVPKELIKDIKPLEIVQTYLQSPEGQERRVRAINNETFVRTVKTPITPDGLKREENERQISQEDYNLFLTQKKGNTIKKRRYKIPVNSVLTFEIDVYEGDLSGLLVVEVEFPSEELAKNFQKPDWFGKEVTSNKAYKNASLAENGLPRELKTGFNH